MKSFPIAPMCALIRTVTLVLLALPLIYLLIAISGGAILTAPVVFLAAIYSWVWLRFRPTRFVVHHDMIEVVWPLKRRQISRDGITNVRVVNVREMKEQLGWAMRVGAGGLWGGFGWLWTQKRGIVQMYISRLNDLVWIERTEGRPWLISPERPDEFVRALSVSRFS